MSHEIPDRASTKVGTDMFHYQGRPYILCVDYFSKYPEVQWVKNETAKACIGALKSIFGRHSIPETVVSDNGPCFDCKEFRDFATSWGFKHETISPGFSQSNGQAENSVKTVKRIMKKAQKCESDPAVGLMEYRATPIQGLDVSPAQLLFNRQIRTFMPTTTAMLMPEV